MVRKLAVLGSPIEHSKSPAIHAAAYRVLGLDWQYSKHEVREGGLRDFVTGLDDSWLGLSLTMPLKEEAARFAISLDETATATKAVNTLRRTHQGWVGANTDVFGIIQALKNAGVQAPATAVVIGSGATATSAVAALAEISPNCELSIFARNQSTKDQLVAFARELGLQASATTRLKAKAKKADVVIATLPANALDSTAEKLAKSRFFKPRGVLLDVVYKNWPTKFSLLWQRAGAKTVNGLDMLIWQAVAQIRLFLNGDAKQALANEVAVVEAMRHAADA